MRADAEHYDRLRGLEDGESRPSRLHSHAVWKRMFVALLAVFVSSCATYHSVAIEAAPRELSVGDSVRFKTTSGQAHRLRIEALDSAGFGAKQEHFLFGEISELEQRRFSWAKTLGLYMGVGLVGLLTVGLDYDFDGLGG